MARVELENLTKTYPGGARAAVDGVSLTMEDREFVVLVGPSGCGKSTTLRMIAGLEQANSGEIRIDGRAVNNVAPKERDIAMVFQNYALYPHMTVYENMAFGLKMRKTAKAEIDPKVRAAAETLGITELLDRLPRALSGGQRQRVALGRAIVRQPKVFLFDEPLSNLDAKMRVAMRAEIKKLHKRLDATMIYVTHDQVEAMTMGDRIVVMHEGKVRQEGAPLEVYDRPADRFVAGFIGAPAMNFFEGKLLREESGLVFEMGEMRLAVAEEHYGRLEKWKGGKVTLGLRPEHFAIAAGGAGDMKARVDLIEPMGAETYITLSTAGVTFTARLDGHAQARPGAELRLCADLKRANWFKAEMECGGNDAAL